MEPAQWKNSCKLVGTCVDHWKDFGIYQVRQGFEVFCKKGLTFISQLSRTAILLRVLGIFCAVVFLLAFVSV